MRRGRLDCHTRTSAIESFSTITGVKSSALRSRLAVFDLEAHFKDLQTWEEPDDVLLRVGLDGQEQSWEPAEICWFHATRVPTNTAFRSQGILPASKSADALWASLRTIDPQPPDEAEWSRFRSLVEGGQLGEWSEKYAIKQKLAGPFAFLIREELDHLGETNSVDYLAAPESIEDICLCYETAFGRQLLDAYRAATRPCVVKFVDWRPERVMGTVARYIYAQEHDGVAFDVNTCFDGKGVAIRPEQILDVEWWESTAVD